MKLECEEILYMGSTSSLVLVLEDDERHFEFLSAEIIGSFSTYGKLKCVPIPLSGEAETYKFLLYMEEDYPPSVDVKTFKVSYEFIVYSFEGRKRKRTAFPLFFKSTSMKSFTVENIHLPDKNFQLKEEDNEVTQFVKILRYTENIDEDKLMKKYEALKGKYTLRRAAFIKMIKPNKLTVGYKNIALVSKEGMVTIKLPDIFTLHNTLHFEYTYNIKETTIELIRSVNSKEEVLETIHFNSDLMVKTVKTLSFNDKNTLRTFISDKVEVIYYLLFNLDSKVKKYKINIVL